MRRLNRYAFQYWYFKLIKQSGTPERVAMGVAIGFFSAFAVPVGQMILAWALAYLFRAAKIPALACTWVTNPYTVPISYPLCCYSGSVAMGAPIKFQHIKKVFDSVIEKPSWDAFVDVGQEFLVPFLLGGLVMGIITGVISYFAAYGIIQRYGQQRKKRLNKRLAEAAQRIPQP